MRIYVCSKRKWIILPPVWLSLWLSPSPILIIIIIIFYQSDYYHYHFHRLPSVCVYTWSISLKKKHCKSLYSHKFRIKRRIRRRRRKIRRRIRRKIRRRIKGRRIRRGIRRRISWIPNKGERFRQICCPAACETKLLTLYPLASTKIAAAFDKAYVVVQLRRSEIFFIWFLHF